MAKNSIFLVLALLLLLSTAQSRPFSTTIRPQAQIPLSSPESSSVEDECKGLDGEECLMRRSVVVHTDYIYTQINIRP
ncbi:phytosulfokine 4 precursor [Hibiscus trionum]|uniref:Phytosulfokine n=1 Tax=Hibiscus trionum TaxID=183268 RepID=A0A9W7I3I4_HIBTR|nr:phytosulfokine 4 precursor [Hibiscus trionum]